jgi:glucose-6-phosphate 1-epimerase
MDDHRRIDHLNRCFAIPGIAGIVAGNGGLPKLRITSPLAIAEIYLHGAQVTSWRPAGFDEILFLSAQSHWQEGRAIRGGVPICFPWFRAKADDAKAPAHGFVRTREWQLDNVTAHRDNSVTVTCSTASDEATRLLWPHEFGIQLRVTVGARLHMELTVTNAGSTPFSFEEALHTYFNVGDVQSVQVRGLAGVRYLDNMDANRDKRQSGDVLFTAATDNAYIETHSGADLIDSALDRVIRTEKENSATTIVWNPWQQGASSLSDLGNDEWQRMVCVEASNILASAIQLAPGTEHTMSATVSVIPA